MSANKLNIYNYNYSIINGARNNIIYKPELCIMYVVYSYTTMLYIQYLYNNVHFLGWNLNSIASYSRYKYLLLYHSTYVIRIDTSLHV